MRPETVSVPKVPAKRCACGGIVEGGGECAACRARRLASVGRPRPSTGSSSGLPPLSALRSLPIASPHDAREHAADAAAGKALAGAPSRGATAAPASPTRDLLGASGGYLPRLLAHDLGSRFGHDFSQIKVFSDETSGRAADALGAAAFTVGQNIYFSSGRYRPETRAGRSLIAHELAHTVQQASGPQLIQRRLAGDCAEEMETVDDQRDELSRVGGKAHRQIESYFSPALDHERRVPRSDKRVMGRACPGVATSYGAVDLVKFTRFTASIGEIKSVDGAKYAAPEVRHYIQRGDESVGRLLGTGPCRGNANNRDRTFDEHWFDGAIQRRRRPPTLQPLDSDIPTTPTDLGPFWGNVKKDLRCERRTGGAVVYWCVPRSSRRRRDSRQSQTAVIPVARPQAQPKKVPTRIVDVAEGFEDAARRMRPVMLAPGHDLVIAFDGGIFDEVTRAFEQAYLEQQRRFMRVNLRDYPAPTTWLAGAMVGGAIVAPVVIAFVLLVAPELIASAAALLAEAATTIAAGEVGVSAVTAGELGTGAVTAGEVTTGAVTAGEVTTGATAVGGAGTAAAGGAGTATAAGAAGTYQTATGVTLTVFQGGAGAAGATAATGGVMSIPASQLAAAAAAIALFAGISKADAADGLRPYIDRPLAAVEDVTHDGAGAHHAGGAISLQRGAFRIAITLTTRDGP